MIKRLTTLAVAACILTGCVNDNSLSGDVYSASEAKQVQSVTYGTLVSVRAVKIQGGDNNSTLGAIGGAVLGGFLGNTIGGGAGRSLATAGGAVLGSQVAVKSRQGPDLGPQAPYIYPKLVQNCQFAPKDT